jgi:acetyl esterase/lipase
MKRSFFLSLILVFIFELSGFAQTQKQLLYKQIDTTTLYMNVIYPKDYQQGKTYPTMIFFFGGAWKTGSVKQFEFHAQYFAERGLIGVLVDYRVESRQHSTPFESLSDAKSAIRYVRIHAKELGIDANKIIASGGSAGGQLAAATALVKGFNDSHDYLSVSCVPNTLVLFNPVIDNGPDGYGYNRIGDKYKEFSPLHNIRKGAPPTIIFLGNQDKLIPVATAEKYKADMEKVGSKCDLVLYDGEGHGFFNKSEYFSKTVYKADQFLASLGYIKGKPLTDRIDFYRDLKSQIEKKSNKKSEKAE